MVNLETEYLGLKLKNPIIVGSSGLTSTPVQIKRLAEAGASAVVLKSIFEEEIAYEYEKNIATKETGHEFFEYYDYFDYKIKEQNLEKYSRLIHQAKQETNIPIIASANAVSPSEWISYATKFEEAGADALEINAFILPSDPSKTGAEIEAKYFEIINQVLQYVKIPVALKIGPYFSGLANSILKLSQTGIKGMVLFNRTYNPDIDLDSMKLVPAKIFSSDWEYILPLRWIALLSGRVNIDLSASTGIHTSDEVIKLILAGAKTTQIVSAIYKYGPMHIEKVINGVTDWMEE
ncbi:dihydroorotate dehydrogenase-like protein, partial [bacterium]|nr:dihydroorotate dehydrogenase-like protein [bacterium]